MVYLRIISNRFPKNALKKSVKYGCPERKNNQLIHQLALCTLILLELLFYELLYPKCLIGSILMDSKKLAQIWKILKVDLIWNFQVFQSRPPKHYSEITQPFKMSFICLMGSQRNLVFLSLLLQFYWLILYLAT